MIAGNVVEEPEMGAGGFALGWDAHQACRSEVVVRFECFQERGNILRNYAGFLWFFPCIDLDEQAREAA